MFLFILALLPAVLALGFYLNWWGESDRKAGYIFWSIAAIMIFSVPTLICYSVQINNFTEIQQTKAQINLFAERRDNLTVMVRSELAKYPEYEKKIIGDITPQILLQFPALKSNETITATMEKIVTLENDVYKLRNHVIEILGTIYAYEVSPWVLYVTPYEKFFGEKNPIAVMGG